MDVLREALERQEDREAHDRGLIVREMGSVLLDGKMVGQGGWLARYAAPYEEVASWGQAVKGDKAFADLAFQKIGEPKLPRKGLTVEAVAREVARRRKLSVEKMRSPSL
jgi:hypothetical protein